MPSPVAASRRVFVSAVSTVVVFESLDARRLLSADLPRLGNVLGYLANDFSTRAESKLSRAVIRNKSYKLAAGQPNGAIVRTTGDTVIIRAVANAKGGKKLAAQLQSLGAAVTSAYGYLLSAAVPVGALAKVNGLSGLNYADASYAPIARAGRTEDLGVQAMNADNAQKQYATTGSGVRVGILSDSYNRVAGNGAAAGVASGDLPSGGVQVVSEYTRAGGTDEGRAMAEVVHDVAPGAAISFYSAYNGEADFANGILTLAKPTSESGQGAKVIVDDVAYFTEPFFQDGVIAQAVNKAYNDYGASYFSAAGNEGSNSYESAFTGTSGAINLSYVNADNTTVTIGPGTFQDFDPSSATNQYQQVTIPAGGRITLSYQWDSPFYTDSRNAGGTASSANSVSLYLLNSGKSGVVAYADNSRVGGDAYQILSYQNTTGTSQTYYLAAKVAGGSAPGYAKYIDYGTQNASYQFSTVSRGTAVGHAVAANGLAVGAAYYGRTPAFNVSPAVRESYSSIGGVPLLFSADGTRLASAQARQQPAIVAPDGAATTFFDSQETSNNAADGQFHFYGTSAAAPHAAGVAALLLEAKPSLTNAQVYSALKSTASDMDSGGFDYNTGFGLVQADAALASVASGSIGGRVYRDLNANGGFDGSDTAVANGVVILDSNNNGVADSGSGTVNSTGSTAIPDATATYNGLSRVSSSIMSTLTGRVTGLSVNVNVSHARFSQVGLTLVTPAGTRIPLLTTLGGINAESGAGIDAAFADSSPAYIQSNATAGTLTGTYKPQTPLSAANGESAAGTWQLEARDYRSGTTGTINNWSLDITYADPTTVANAGGQYLFTGLKPSAFYGTYRVAVAGVGGYTLATPSSGSYVINLTTGGTSGPNDFRFVAANGPATIASIVLDDGTAQRSVVRSVTVLLNGTIPPANIAAGAFTLTQTSGPTISTYAANVASVTTPAPGQTAIKLTFSGASVVAGSVADGRYTLAIDGSRITTANGTPTDALGNGNAGSIRTYAFTRLYGDVDGDAGVSINDFNAFATAFGSTSPSTAFISALDYDGDSGISINDFNQFATRFGMTI